MSRYSQVDCGGYSMWVESSDSNYMDVDYGGYSKVEKVGSPKSSGVDEMLPDLESSLYSD